MVSHYHGNTEGKPQHQLKVNVLQLNCRESGLEAGRRGKGAKNEKKTLSSNRKKRQQVKMHSRTDKDMDIV